jgi:ABC-type multidrug transport system fused ATPase/permease subunit
VLNQLGPAGLAAVAVGAGIGLVGVGALVGYLITYLTSATAERVGADLREVVFGRMLGLGLPFHDRHRSGDLVTRLTGDVARVEDSMVAWFTVLVPEVLTLAGMVVVVLTVDLTLGLAALAVVPPLAMVVAMRRRRIRVAQRASRDADAALASEATEVLRNVRVVQAFTREDEAGGHFSGRSRGAVRAALGAMDLEARWSPVADLLLAAGGGLVLWLGAEPRPAGPPRHGLFLRGVWFAYAEGAPVLRHLDLKVAAGKRVCVSGRPVPASRPCSPCCCGSTTHRPARSSSTAPTCASWAWARSGASSPWCPRSRGCWTAPSPTTSPSDVALGGLGGENSPPNGPGITARRAAGGCRRPDRATRADRPAP